MGNRPPSAGGPRPAHHHAQQGWDLLVAEGEEHRADGQQHLQWLAVRGRLAGEVKDATVSRAHGSRRMVASHAARDEHFV